MLLLFEYQTIGTSEFILMLPNCLLFYLQLPLQASYSPTNRLLILGNLALNSKLSVKLFMVMLHHYHPRVYYIVLHAISEPWAYF